MKDLKAFIRNAGTLPSPPAIYYELSHALDNPDSSLDSIAKIIRKDPGLTSRLLRLANSVLFSASAKVETIEDSIQLIGMREMRELAMATCVIKSFVDLPVELVDTANFWKHSIACACASSLLAEMQLDPSPERLFVGGLMHDIGHLVLFLKAPQESKDILLRAETEDIHLLALEREVLGFDHAELGSELINYWGLPPMLSRMVQRHHAPANTVLGQDEAIVHCGDFLTSALAFGGSGETALWNLSSEAVQICQLDNIDLEALAHEIEIRYQQLCPLMATP